MAPPASELLCFISSFAEMPLLGAFHAPQERIETWVFVEKQRGSAGMVGFTVYPRAAALEHSPRVKEDW